MGVASGLNALLQEHHTFVSGTAKRFGVSSSTLNQAVKNGKILREARGVYVENGYTWDDFEVLSQRYTKGVFALDTALFLHGLTDQLPDRFNMGLVPAYSVERTLLEFWERSDVAPYSRKEAINNYMYEYGNNVNSYKRLKKLKEQLYPQSDIFKLLEVLA